MKIDLNHKRNVLVEKHSAYSKKKMFFLSFLDGCEIQIDKQYFRHLTFYTKNGKILFVKNSKNKIVRVRWRPIWMDFFYIYEMSHKEIQEFVKPLVEKYLELDNFTVDVLTPESSKQLEKISYKNFELMKQMENLLSNGN